MDPNNYNTIEAMVKAFEKAARFLQEEEPDCIIAPMFGAVPFIDILNIVDENFPNHKVEYVPASNKVHRLRQVLRGAFMNIIDAYAPHGGKFISLDEVVSGNSLVRVYKQFSAARMQHANRATIDMYGETADFREPNVSGYRDDLVKSIVYKTVGVVDPKLRRTGKKMSPEYEALVEQGVVWPVDTEGIVTMDRTEFFPAKYLRETDGDGNKVYSPVVNGFTVSPEYIKFLKQVASIVGKDPDRVTLSNMGKISEAHKWVPEELRYVS